ncbi:hypothetical protein [Ruegeria faecimaris]|uniref:Uncharacterized protein n=1 Tax=Ruegeria faecimaris TaxID=686389 RepID=A0A521C4X4_9RHOB|nr:hypothetical protein [Ruegeria faecimaris]SMO54567.1 hypothetical protein SAMN06265380_102134 [Ruegeria faecimaris]
MTRWTTFSTVLGLIGLLLAMLTALAAGTATLIAFGLAMMVLGFTGSVIGAARSLGRVLDAAR